MCGTLIRVSIQLLNVLDNYYSKRSIFSNNMARFFFREGKSGSWKSQLDKKITDKIENLFFNEMKELNYL